MKLSKSLPFPSVVLAIILLIMCIGVYIYKRYVSSTEGFEYLQTIHFYWIVSDKRKPMMTKQLQDRNKLNEANIHMIPGIFNDDVGTAGHPNLPKEWLGFPVARLLAAHMKAIRNFCNEVANVPNKQEHVFVCLEDDVILHKNFETMVEQAANFVRTHTSTQPIRLSLGFVDIPENKILINSENNLKISQLHGDSTYQNGTQCYMLNYKYAKMALEEYEAAYRSRLPDPNQPNQVASDHFLFLLPNTSHFIMEPPACLEDNPTFGSMLGHTQNEYLFKKMTNAYPLGDYYSFSTQK